MKNFQIYTLLLAFSIAILSVNGIKHRMRQENVDDTELLQYYGLTGTKVTQAEDYCYYVFRDLKYKRCLDADDGKFKSKKCRSDDDQKWQLLPGDGSQFYYRSKEYNTYIQITSRGERALVSDMSKSTRLTYQHDSGSFYTLKTPYLRGNVAKYYGHRYLAAKKQNKGYMIKALEDGGIEDKRTLWEMYKQSDACVKV